MCGIGAVMNERKSDFNLVKTSLYTSLALIAWAYVSKLLNLVSDDINYAVLAIGIAILIFAYSIKDINYIKDKITLIDENVTIIKKDLSSRPR